MTKTYTAYQVRRFEGNNYSRSLSNKLRPYNRARKLAKRVGGFVVKFTLKGER